MSSMVRNMTSENMVAVSEQTGVKPSREDAEKVKSVADNLTPDDLERMVNVLCLLCCSKRIDMGAVNQFHVIIYFNIHNMDR